jgi:ParB family chromosome partitioning protein
MIQTEPITAGPQLQQLDPATLLVDRNVRHQARLDTDFVASIRDHGVLVPIVAARTTDGQVRVRFGHRRVLAAIEAKQNRVPVIVAADEATDDTAQIDRLVGQYAENQHRTGLSNAEKAGVVNQLAAFGVSPAQITKRLRTPRTEVDAALTVGRSELATAATERYEFLTLDQAATVAEFEDQPETVKALVAAAKTGQFDHVAQRARDARDEAATRAAAVAGLAATGLTLIDRPEPGSPAKQIEHLTDDEETREPIGPDAHAACPGHAAYLVQRWIRVDGAAEDPGSEDDEDEPYDEDADSHETWGWAPVYVCTDPAAHGHRPRWRGHDDHTARIPAADKTDEQREADRAQRREVITNNKAWKSAETVRRDWLRTFLTRKTAPKGSTAFLAHALAHGDHEIRRAMEQSHPLGRDLLGLDTTSSGYGHGTRQLLDLLAAAAEARAQVIALGLLLAAYEDATGTHSWRRTDDATRRHLTFLADHGYTLSGVERRACGLDPLAADDTD